jgi:hypothetical protein
MSYIITQGLGGGSLITRGYGFWAGLKKIVSEVISRLIPSRRRKVLLSIPVYGSPVYPFEENIKVTGEKDFSIFWTILEDED